MEISSAIPIGVMAKSFSGTKGSWVKGAPLDSHQPAIRSFNIMSGLDPISVRQPPVMAQNPMGIRILAAEILSCLLMRMVAGRKTAAAPIFCIRLEITATVAETISIIRFSPVPAILIICVATVFITPVFFNPAPIIIMAMMETTASELNPATASSGVTTPESGNKTIMRSPTRSTRSRSKTKRIMARPRRAKTIIISVVRATGTI